MTSLNRHIYFTLTIAFYAAFYFWNDIYCSEKKDIKYIFIIKQLPSRFITQIIAFHMIYLLNDEHIFIKYSYYDSVKD